MITSLRRCASGELQRDLDADAMRAALREGDGVLWVDVTESTREEGDALLGAIFGFHPLTIDDCYNHLIDPPKVDDYGDYLFIIVHNVQYDAERRRLSTSELDLYIGRNFVVTFHQAPLRAIDEVMRRAEQQDLVTRRGADFLAHALIDVIVDDFHPVVETLDEQLASIEEAVLEVPERETLQQVLQLKRNAQRLKRTILPQRDVANRFARGEYDRLIRPESLMYFRDVYDHTVRVDEMIESVRDLADGALNTYLSSVNNRINEVMKTLAIVTAIFLPLTLIAGIYGTNFENVPEYGWGAGYFLMLVAMAGVAAGLVLWFRWRRWF